jgi:hypothetical protein
VEKLFESGRSGEAYHELSQGLDDPDLREEAVRLVRENAEILALQSDMDPGEVMKDVGITLEEQYPTGHHVDQARMFHSDTGIHFWVGEEEIVYFPKVKDVQHQAMRNDAILAVRKALRVREDK